MKDQYESTWWKAWIPGDWDTSEDNVCVTFTMKESSGVIQVSASAKGAGPVTESDLKELAQHRIAKNEVRAIKTMHFDGIQVEYSRDDKFWRELWLRSGNLMLYVTYNVEKKSTDVERAAVDEFISGLEPSSK